MGCDRSPSLVSKFHLQANDQKNNPFLPGELISSRPTGERRVTISSNSSNSSYTSTKVLFISSTELFSYCIPVSLGEQDEVSTTYIELRSMKGLPILYQ